MISDKGVAGRQCEHSRDQTHIKLTNERVSTGIDHLDTMLGGGYFRGASVLITGYSGTAKTTLSGLFAEAACRNAREGPVRLF